MTDSPNLSAHNIAWKDRAAHAPITPGGSPNPLSVVENVGFIPPDDPSETADAPPDPDKTTKLKPDREVLAQFISIMFKNASPDGFISLRLFPDKGSRQEKPIDIEPIRVGDRDLLNITVIRATQAANWHEPAVFSPPVATFLTSENAKTDNICEGVALSVECDQLPQQAWQTLEAILGEPTVVVESGGEWINPETGEIESKVHLHWRLAKPTSTKAEHDTLREARNLATDLVGGDGTNKSIVHPIRWPGSWHRKNEPRLAKMAALSGGEIDLAEAVKRLRVAAGADAAGPKTSSKLRSDDPEAVKSALSVIPNDNLVWNDWNVIGMATWAATEGSEIGREAFATWSAKSSKNDPAATENRWQHYKTSPPTKIGFGSLVYLARKHSPGWSYGPADAAVDPVDLWAKFDPPTLPRGILPDVIERFAFDQGMTMGADMAGIAVGALAVCAAAIPDKIQLQVKRHNPGWLESARLWVALVGPVSAKKSPIMSSVVRPLRRIDSEMARRYAEERAKYDKLTKEEKSQTQPPKQTRLLLQDTTIEAAQDILKDSIDGMLSYHDELSGWFGSMDKYSGSRGAAKDRAFWLEAYNGAEYSVNRVGRGSVYIENLSVSILGGIQPEPIRKLADESMDDGLLQRLLPVVLRGAVEGRDEPQSEIVAEYSALINRLHNLDMVGSGIYAGTTLRFDEGAQNLRQELERRHLELQSIEALNRKLAAHIGKYDGIFARLCVVWHCVENAGERLPTVIAEATARRAAGFLHSFLLPHAVAFYAGTLGLSNDHDRLAAVAGYILARKLERITNRDVQRGDRTMRGLGRKEIEAVFDQLDALGWIGRVAAPRPTDPAHWIVNPAVHAKFAERAEAEKGRRERERETIADLIRGGGGKTGKQNADHY